MPSDDSTTAADIGHFIRVITGLALIGALVLISFSLHSTLDQANATLRTSTTQGPSAIQIIQVYTQSLFQAVVAIGAGIAIYVGTRAWA